MLPTRFDWSHQKHHLITAERERISIFTGKSIFGLVRVQELNIQQSDGLQHWHGIFTQFFFSESGEKISTHENHDLKYLYHIRRNDYILVILYVFNKILLSYFSGYPGYMIIFQLHMKNLKV